jgi:hypothetical protein
VAAETENQICPLCGSRARYSVVDRQREHVQCGSCGEYVLWEAAERSLEGCASTMLEHFAAQVRATTDPTHIYVIRPARSDETPAEIMGEALARSEAFSKQ